MLADWYFCCCIGASPDKTVAFLSILETLANPDSDTALLQTALTELERADSWMQWYAVPQVLDALHHSAADSSLRQSAHRCIIEILRELPRETLPEYEEVLAFCLNRDNPPELLAKLAALAMRPRREGRQPAEQPYLDLHEFAPESVLLAIMQDCLRPASGATAELRRYLKSQQGDGALNGLIEEALGGRLGRLAFRLAASVARQTMLDSSLARRVMAAPHADLAFEPDLVRTLAEVLYQGRPAADILDETLTLVNLPPAPEHNRPLRTLGLEALPEDRWLALGIALWQATLWDLAAQTQPATAAADFMNGWQMRETNQRPRDKLLYISAAPHASEDWLQWLDSFWKALALPDEPSLPLQIGRGAYRRPSDLLFKLLSSPLLPIQSASFKARSPLDRLLRYPTGDQPVAQLRLWSGALTAVRLLQQLPEGDPARPALALVIAETADSINLLYGHQKTGWLKNYAKRDQIANIERRLPLSLTGLALFTARQVNLAGRGHIPSIAPREFVDLLSNPRLPTTFKRWALPPVLMRWIGDGYLGATPGRPSARWLDLIAEVDHYFEYAFYRDHRYDPNVTEWAGLVVRFLCPDVWDPEHISHLNWQTALNHYHKPTRWKVSARQFLLTKALTPADWLPSWPEPELDLGRKLTRAIERLSSLQRGPAPEPDLPERWRQDWFDAINSIVEHTNLDRFVRLRLVEFLDDPALANNPDGQELIGLTLLEHGGPYELHRLFGRLYQQPGQVSVARQKVQIALIPAILKFATLSVEAQELRPNPRDPRLTREDFRKGELLQGIMLWLANPLTTASHPEWRRCVAELRQDEWDSQANRTFRTRRVEVEITNDRKRLLLERGEVPTWALQAICYDPNQVAATLFYKDVELGSETTVLFGQREREISAFLRSEFDSPRDVLALVSKESYEPNRRPFPYQYSFEIGAWFELKSDQPDRRFRKGDLVLLPLEQNPSDPTRLRVATSLPIKPVQRRWQIGDLAWLTLREDNHRGRRTLHLTLESDKTVDLWPEVSPDLWDPDLSRLYQSGATLKSSSILAEWGADKRWRPLDQDLADWLAAWPAEDAVVIGTYAGPATTAHGQDGWRFAVQPAQNYILLSSHLPPADAKALAQAVQDSQPGLLVAFELNPVLDGPKLRLARSAALPEAITARYPALQLPFDRRNWDWANLFAQDVERIALRDPQPPYWCLDLGESRVPGFPDSLPVKWVEEPPPSSRIQAELSDVQWNPRRGVVIADWVQAFEAHPRHDDWSDFCARWLNPRPGMLLNLRRTQGKVNPDGLIGCLTDERIYVQVETESLTMLPWRGAIRLTDNRAAEIYYVTGLKNPTPLEADDLAALSILRDQQRCRGIVTSVPREDEASTLCQVVWETAPSEPMGLHIRNAIAARLRPGMVIIASWDAGSWSLKAYWRGVYARALWRLTDAAARNYRVTYLGTVTDKGLPRALAEAEPGQLVWLTQLPVGLNHLAQNEGETFAGGEPFGRLMEAYINNKGSRTTLSLPAGQLYGGCRSRLPKGTTRLFVSGIQVQLNHSQFNTGYCWLKRTFDLRLSPASEDNPNRHWQKLLDEYLLQPEPLDVTSDGRTVTLRGLRVPTDAARTTWIPQAAVAPAHGPFLETVEYASDALIILFTDIEQNVWASFRQVPPYTPEQYREEVVGAGFDSQPHNLLAPLYYVGHELSDPEDPLSERCHRFEWGRGLMLLVPESQLRFNNQPFRRSELVLAYGDMVTAVTFWPGDPVPTPVRPALVLEEPESEASEPARCCILDIQEFHIEFSQGRTLYEQRKSNVVHVLRLQGSGKDLRISLIQGFDNRQAMRDRVLGQEMRDFKPAASLDENSLKRLQNRWPSDSDTSIDRVILGRLNEAIFQESVGSELVYEHVSLTFLPDRGGAPLRSGELVFMRAGRLVEDENDVRLEVSPLANLDSNDIGPDFGQPLRLNRRFFSVRENLLYRILSDSGSEGLRGTVILVRLTKDGNRINTSLQHGLTRLERALRRAIQASNELLFACVLSEPGDGTLRLELKPGLFVKVPYSNPERLQKGDVVGIEFREGVYRVIQVTPAQRRYLGSGLRPAIGLPMDSLFNNELGQKYSLNVDKTWLEREFRFTLGGLPGVVAQPGSCRESRGEWLEPVASDFIRLMRTLPPQIVTVGLDRSGRPRIAPQSLPGWVAGHLELTPRTQCVVSRAWEGNGQLSEPQPLDWLFLTFGDMPVRDVIKRIRREIWRYHDRRTGYWTQIDDQLASERLYTQAMNALSGPIFFEGNRWRLRYSPDHFLRVGYPVQELVQALWSSKKRKRYPVAGLSDVGGLWVELAPGRVVELPATMVFFQTPGRVWPLANLQWQIFAPGDIVELMLWATDSFTPDRIMLVNWQPGPRQAFGPVRCVLPIVQRNVEAGALRLGAGSYQLTLPVAEPAAIGVTVILMADNTLMDATGYTPNRDDVVLLGLDEKRQVHCIGFSGYTPLPERGIPALWGMDPLANDLLGNADGLQALIEAAGGALPVTVEQCDHVNGWLTYSRRWQLWPTTAPCSLTMGKVVGVLGRNEKSVLVRCGGALLKASLNQVIAGLPADQHIHSGTAAALRELQTVVWLQVNPAGRVTGSGLPEDGLLPNLEFAVQPLSAVGGPDGCGLICQAVDSQKLFWLPDRQLAWIPLKIEHLRQYVVGWSGRTLWVRRQPRVGATDTISVLRADRASQELTRLGVGREMVVRVVARLADAAGARSLYLVESFSSNVLLACETQKILEPGQLLPVEVVRRSSGATQMVITAPAEERPQLLDVPSWMLTVWPQTRRESWQAFLDRCSQPLQPNQLTLEEVSEAGPDRLTEYLASAEHSPITTPEVTRLQSKIALRWKQVFVDDQSRPELEVGPALTAVLLLDKIGQTLSKSADTDQRAVGRNDLSDAVRILMALGQRALRSLHSEVFSRTLLGPSTLRRREDLLGRCLQDLALRLSQPLNIADLEAIRSFCRVVMARRAPDFLSLASGLAASVGDISDLKTLWREASVCMSLIQICGTLPADKRQLDSSTRIHLQRLAKQILAQDLDVVLLDPILLS